MLLVKTRLGVSHIHGIGLFAQEFIAAGTLIWVFHPKIDLKLTSHEIAELPPACRVQIERYSYKEKHSGLYLLCGDDARFFNHTADPNCVDLDNGEEGITIAKVDIEPGTELTCDYSLFDQDWIDGNYQL